MSVSEESNRQHWSHEVVAGVTDKRSQSESEHVSVYVDGMIILLTLYVDMLLRTGREPPYVIVSEENPAWVIYEITFHTYGTFLCAPTTMNH